MLQLSTQNKIQNNIFTKKSITFGEGKAHLYSDFDRTYLPATHKGFASIPSAEQAPDMKQYFKNFRNFLNNTRQGFKFTITTGRNFAEFETMAELARDRKFDMPLPDTLIAKNGSDEHTRVGTDEEFYKGGKFPFTYEATNKQKEEDLNKLTGWDGAKVKAKLRELLQKHGCTIREYATTNSANDYGNKSALSHLDNTPNLAILRQDGNLKVFYSIINEPDILETEKASQKIYSDIREELIKEKISYGYKSQHKDRDFNKYSSDSLSPEFMENSSGLNGETKFLTKLYDTQQAVKKAAKENDLVIVAGDSSNDFEMLNPVRYLSEHLDNDDDLCYLKDRPDYMVEEMNKRPELAKKFQELPFVGIVVKNKDKSDAGLDSLVKHFGEGKYKKIIVVEEGHLLDGVKQAIKMHSEQNPEYRAKLTADLKKEVLGIVGETIPDKSNPPPSPKGKIGWIIAGIASVVAALGVIYYNQQNNSRRESHKNVRNI